jgi:hypothetical protein
VCVQLCTPRLVFRVLCRAGDVSRYPGAAPPATANLFQAVTAGLRIVADYLTVIPV